MRIVACCPPMLNLAGDDICLAYEIGDEGGSRGLVEVAWRTGLGDLPSFMTMIPSETTSASS